MSLLIWITVLVIAVAVLVKASDFFVDGASGVGKAIGMPPFVVGVIIVGIGTSLPELVSSVVSVAQGASEIVLGNVLGSNITNIFLVLGVTAFVAKEHRLKKEILNGDLSIFLAVTLLLYFMLQDGAYTFGEALFSLLALSIYVIYSLGHSDSEGTKKTKIEILDLAKLIVAPILIFLGAKYTVESVIKISEILSIAKEVIALSAVALGTSLPEVMVTISATKKGNTDMAVGNIVGSNIFNSLAVTGISRFVGVVVVPKDVLTFSLPLSVAAAVIFVIITMSKNILRWEAAFLLVFYAYFISHLFGIV